MNAFWEYPKARLGIGLGKGRGFVRIEGLSGIGIEFAYD